MKTYFAYIRVSTVKQGEKGSSLQEQKAAIEGYAHRHNLVIAEWFEETETAAKQGRPVFTKMLAALMKELASGVITHKIDRSARNLRDWALLGDLLDRGIELHFAHESIDLSSRGGRLSADIQAVVAADYIRNLRDEVIKGFYGRLKQGLYPLRAPIGYLDQGGGVAKAIDPVRGPLVAKAFELYSTGHWSLETLSAELFSQGLRTRGGTPVTRNGFSTILNNPFYVGLIRIEKTHEVFQGVHSPLIDKSIFDRVRAVLSGHLTHKANLHHFRYQRTLRCCVCGYSLIASRQKGHVYYRCHTRTCPTTCVREERIDAALRTDAAKFNLTEAEWVATKTDVEALLVQQKVNVAAEARNLDLAIAAIDERMGRLTDAYVDQVVDRESYLTRKEQLLGERATVASRRTSLEAGDDVLRNHADKILELIKALGSMPDLENDDKLRQLLKETTSNLGVCGKNVAIAWANPFQGLVIDEPVTLGGPKRIKPRTLVQRLSEVVREYIVTESKKRDDAEAA